MARQVYKFGSLPTLALGATADLWVAGGDLYYPAENAETTLLSGSVQDAIAGTGARSLTVQGIVKDAGPVYREVSEEVVPTGEDLVTLTTQFWRVYRGWARGVGSGGVNAGDIDIKHGANVLARIAAGDGQTLQAGYTVPEFGGRGLHLLGWRVCPSKGGQTASIQAKLYARRPGESWRVLDAGGATSNGAAYFAAWGKRVNYMEPGSDIRIRITDNVANATAIAGSFWLKV